jgi:hypothetical protein
MWFVALFQLRLVELNAADANMLDIFDNTHLGDSRGANSAIVHQLRHEHSTRPPFDS